MANSPEFKDAWGLPLAVGDAAMWVKPTRRGGTSLKRVTVTGFTAKMVRVSYPSPYKLGTVEAGIANADKLLKKPS